MADQATSVQREIVNVLGQTPFVRIGQARTQVFSSSEGGNGMGRTKRMSQKRWYQMSECNRVPVSSTLYFIVVSTMAVQIKL